MYIFPCIICGKEFKTKEDWDKEIQRINLEYPNFIKGVQQAYAEEQKYLPKFENHFRNMKLKKRREQNDN